MAVGTLIYIYIYVYIYIYIYLCITLPSPPLDPFRAFSRGQVPADEKAKDPVPSPDQDLLAPTSTRPSSAANLWLAARTLWETAGG